MVAWYGKDRLNKMEIKNCGYMYIHMYVCR